MDLTVAYHLGIALALGFIVGMERSWKDRESPDKLLSAGIRSFALASLLGGVGVLLAETWGVWILAALFLGLSGLVGISYWTTAQASKDFGITTELSLLLTFTLGCLAVGGSEVEAVAIATLTSVILGFKEALHRPFESLSRDELTATLKLLLIAAVALPLLPNDAVGPWQAIQPRAIGLLVLLIAGISYVGYFAVRLLGSRAGLLLTGLLGGLASSTAVTVTFARIARSGKEPIALLATAIALANGTMVPRLLMEVAVVNRSLALAIAPGVMLLALVPLIAGILVAWRLPQGNRSAELPLKNPIDLRTALFYGALLTVLAVVVRAVEIWFGQGGIYALAAVSGMADVDAVSISLAQAVNSGLALTVAARGVFIAVLMNTGFKVVLAGMIGGRLLAQWSAALLLGAIALGFIAVFV